MRLIEIAGWQLGESILEHPFRFHSDYAHRSFVIGIDRHALQTQFPPSRIELWNAPQFRLPSLHSVLITSAARNPIATIATAINGHSTTNQKEIFESGF
jgi:hypothetical protein